MCFCPWLAGELDDPLQWPDMLGSIGPEKSSRCREASHEKSDEKRCTSIRESTTRQRRELRNGGRSGRFDRSDESVALTSHGFDVAWRVGGIGKNPPQAV